MLTALLVGYLFGAFVGAITSYALIAWLKEAA